MRDEQALTPPGGGAHVEPWLDAYRTGELADSERLRVERHLQRCPDCTARLAEIESFGRLVTRGFAAAAARPTASVPDWDRQRREILARTVEPRSVERRPAPHFRWAPQAALAVLALLVLGILARQGLRSPADLERMLEKEKRVATSTTPEPRPAPEVGQPSGSDSFAPSFRLDQAPAGDRVLETPSTLADRDKAAEVGEPSGEAGAAGKLEETRKTRVGEGEERAAAAPAPAVEQKRAAAREAAPKPAAEGAKEADLRGQDRRVEAPPSEANDAGVVADDAQAVRQNALRSAVPAPMDLLQRLDLYARKALASGDSVEAARALVFWRDSVAVRGDLNPARKRAAAALVDSLARRVPR